ncbi:hypothetical protein YC2023_059936 [Brassica napus]
MRVFTRGLSLPLPLRFIFSARVSRLARLKALLSGQSHSQGLVGVATGSKPCWSVTGSPQRERVRGGQSLELSTTSAIFGGGTCGFRGEGVDP